MTTEEAIKMMYDAAVCAVCHCNDNPAGVYPCKCDCEQTKRTDESLKMLRDVRNEILTDFLNKK